MPLVLSRATRADLRELVDLHHKVFTDPEYDVLVGFDTADGRQAAVQRWQQRIDHDAGDVWLKVVDSDAGRIVSAAQWKVYPNWVPIETPPVQLDWFPEGEERALAEDLVNKIIKVRVEYEHGEPHIVLNRLYTDQDYQGRGAGARLVKWGCDLADSLFVPAWLESSPVAERLYRAYGFADVVRPDLRNQRYNLNVLVMKREARMPA